MGTTRIWQAHEVRGHLVMAHAPDIRIRLDPRGRIASYYHGRTRYRRSLNGSFYFKANGEHQVCDDTHMEAVVEDIRQVLKDICAQKQPGLERPIEGSQLIPLKIIRKACEWCSEAYREERSLFREAYGRHIPQPPPNRAGDLVVQATRGCPNNECTFCAWYDDMGYMPFSFKSFFEHLVSLKMLIGEASANREGLFLVSSELLNLSQRTLLKALEMIDEHFGRFPRGTCAFIDPDHYEPRDDAAFLELRQAGIVQFNICLESGDEGIRHLVGRLTPPEAIAQLIGQLKKAGFQLGLTIWVGTDGNTLLSQHLAATGSFLKELPLDKGDVLYLTPLNRRFPQQGLEQRFHMFHDALATCSLAKIINFPKNSNHMYA